MGIKMDIREQLRHVGFKENEILVYMTLIDYGMAKVGRIVKITGIQKSSCYMAINSLLHKGIISTVNIGNIAHFKAENPKAIIDYIEEKKDIIKSGITELERRFIAANKSEGSVSYFKGVKGIKAVFNDILREGKDNDVFGSEGQLSDKMPVFVRQYMRRQDEGQIKTRNLVRKGRKRKYSKGTKYKYVEKDVRSNVVTNIYGDKIAILIWTEDPEAIIIKNKTAADSYRSYFDFMWDAAKKAN